MRWDNDELFVVEFFTSLGILTGLTVEDKLNLALVGVELLLVVCRTGLTTLLKYKENYLKEIWSARSKQQYILRE